MIPIMNCKKMMFFDPVSVTNAGTATGYIDCLDYDYAVVDVLLTTSNAATNNPSVLKLAQSADATNSTNITALVGDGTGGFTVPSCVTATDDDVFASLNVDLRGKARYLHLSVSPLTTQVIAAVATLYRGAETPVGTTKQNCKVIATG